MVVRLGLLRQDDDVEFRMLRALRGAAHSAGRRPFRRVVDVWFDQAPTQVINRA